MAAELKHFAAFGARIPKFTLIVRENSRALVRKRFLHGATFSRWKAQAQIVASSSIGDIRANIRQSVIRGFSRAPEVAVDFNEERLKVLSERGLSFPGDKSKTIGQPTPVSHPHLLEEDERHVHTHTSSFIANDSKDKLLHRSGFLSVVGNRIMVWYFTLRRISSLVFLSCLLVATFVTIFLHFHGLEISSFNSGVTAFKNIQQNKPLTLESTSYHIVNGNNVVMELLKATPPDLYPTPTRPRRGTPDGTFVTPGITKKEYRDRRHKLLSLLAKTHYGETHDRHLVIIPSNPMKYMTTDVPYPFRQNTDFLYLTGFQEPDAVLVLQSVKGQPFPAHKSTLFIHPQDPKRELWDGKRAGTKDAILFFGFDESYSIRNLPSVLTDRFAGKDFCVWYDHLRPTNPVIHDEISKVLFHSEKFTYKNLLIVGHNTHMLRLIKSEAEIKLLRESASLTARAISKVMKSTRPGLEESHLHNLVEYECRMGGAERLAYPPVVASGPMANTLHYINNTQVLRDGELVLMDAGSEYHGYSSDITRTWPVSGKFSDAQRELYELVLRVHKNCLKLCQKGASLDYIHHAMLVLLGEELVKTDFLPKNLTESQLKKGAAEFCPHHVGHYLGMDTHDTHMVSRGLGLHPGMVITVEPGIYISQSNEKVPERYRGIGIRIEDDVLITENGAEVLTAECPKEVDEIERLMINTEMKTP